MTESDKVEIGAKLIAAAEEDELPFLGWKEASDSDKRVALIKALKAGNVAFADVISGPIGSELRTETNFVDLTLAEALAVFATQSAEDVCRFVIDHVGGVISALITSLQTQGAIFVRAGLTWKHWATSASTRRTPSQR